jgi:MoaA/NifB/PqqE/SkfB family radical SAM enzyme
MATWTDRITHPLRTIRNAKWKTEATLRNPRHRVEPLWEAMREQLGRQPPWIVARNRRKLVVDYGPPNIFLEPTNACNLRCPMCPTGVGKSSRGRGLLSLDLVGKLVSEIRHQPQQFGFWLAGEPLLHPQIVEMVGLAARAGLKPAIHSNATKLTRDLAQGLIKSGLNWISFSFDGDNRADYERLRQPASYDDTVERIRMFLSVRRELGSATPRVVLQTLIPYENEAVHPYGVHVEPSPEFRQQFDGYGVDEFRALLAHSWSGQLDGYQGVAPNHKLTGRRWLCIVPWRDVTIAWNGDLVSCCGDLDGVNVIDNIRDKSLYDAWNGPGYQAFRKAMLGGGIEKWALCGECERIWTERPHRTDYRLRFEMLRYRLRF